jgi:hypothetical protein
MPGAINRTLFETYIKTQFAPTLRAGDVVILDNLSSHKGPKAAEMLREPMTTSGETSETSATCSQRENVRTTSPQPGTEAIRCDTL